MVMAELPKPPIPDAPKVTQIWEALRFMPMLLLPPAASTVPPEMVMVPSASSGWLSAVLAVQTTTVPPEMVRLPLESKPSPPEEKAVMVPPEMFMEKA